MAGQPYSKQEFRFCYRALLALWRADSKLQRENAKAELIKVRTLYHSLHDEMGVIH